MSARRRGWLALAAYALLACLMTWPLAARMGSSLGQGLDPLLQSWILAWDSHALLADPLRIWDAPIFAPYPDALAYTDHHLPQLPLAAPVIWLTGNAALAHNLLVLLSYALSGWAVFLLAREMLGARAPEGDAAAFVAGAAFAFCAFRMAQFVHLQMLQTAWLPLALLFLRRALAPGGRWRDALLCGLFAGLQSAAALYYSYFAALALALFAASALLAALAGGRLRSLGWRWWARLGLAALAAAAIALPLALPYVRVYQTLGIVRSARELENWSAPLQAYLAAAPGSALYGRLGAAFAPSGGELALSPGVVAALLALIGAWAGLRSRARRPETLALLALAAAAFALSLGTALRLTRGGPALPVPLPYGLLYERAPGFGALRVPARWGELVALAACLLAAGGLASLLGRLRGRARWAAAALALALVLGESFAPAPLSGAPDLASAAPVYAWLGQPAQADAGAVLELPAGRTQRGAELDRTMLRQYAGMLHWRPLAVGYSGLMPFGTADLLGQAQGLPAEGALRYLQLAGVGTLVLHRDELAPDALAKLTAGLDSSPLARRRAEVGEALVYTLLPPQGADLPAGASAFLTGDERAPGTPALALARRWAAAGVRLYGPARPRYYGALGQLRAGQVADYALLADDEDPRPLGYAAPPLWSAAGLALYQRDPALLASVALGAPPPGRFHPASPAEADITLAAGGATVAGREVRWDVPASGGAFLAATVELDVASLTAQTLQVGAGRADVPPGVTTVRVVLGAGGAARVAGRPGETAILRARVYAGERAADAGGGAWAAAAEPAIEGGRLRLGVRAGGASGGELVIEARGASAYDDRPVLLFRGRMPAPGPGEALALDVDLLRPEAPWVQEAGKAEDGRYIVYLRRADRPGSPGLPVAKFSVRGGRLADPEPVPLPLTELR